MFLVDGIYLIKEIAFLKKNKWLCVWKFSIYIYDLVNMFCYSIKIIKISLFWNWVDYNILFFVIIN